MEKRKSGIMQSAICIGLLCLIWGGYLFVMKKINQTIEHELADDFSWVVQVDEVRTEEDEFVLEGFAFQLDKNAENKAFDIVLHNLDTGEYLFPKMEYEDRKDVNDYFLCEYDYTKSGFTARIKEKKLDLTGNDYEVLLRPKWSHNPYQFNTYLSDGELMYANPKEYVPLDVAGTDLEEIVEEGVVRMWSPKMGFYVYQYDDKIICVMSEEYKTQSEYVNRIILLLYTTQKDMLSTESKERNSSCDEINAYFEDTAQFSNFFVREIELPSEYAITHMEIGNYNNEHWVWNESIRPVYKID